jgi:hypothetical protein
MSLRMSRIVAKRAAIIAAALAGLSVVGVVLAILILQGATLASFIRKVLPPMRGTIEMKAVRWKARALVDLLTDRPTPVVVDGLKISDPEGTVVLEVPHLEVKIRPRSAIGGKIYLHDLVVSPGSLWRFASLRRSPDDTGFLVAFDPPGVKPPPPPPGTKSLEPTGDPFFFQIVNADLQGLTAVFDFEGWGLELRNSVSPVSLIVDGKFVGWDAKGLVARNGGYLRIMQEVLPFDRVEVTRVATTREWPDEIYLDVKAARTGRSVLTAKGRFTEIYGNGTYAGERDPEPGIDLHAEFSEAADALGAVAAGHAIPGLRIGGTGAKLTADLKKPFANLEITTRLSGLDVHFGDYQARALALRAHFVVDPMKLALQELSFASPGGGKFILGADLAGTAVNARIRFDRFSTASYLPAPLRALAAGKLNGHLAIGGDFGDDKRVALRTVELAFDRTGAPARGKKKGAAAAAGKAPRQLRITGQATANRNRIATAGLKFEVPGATAELKGEIALARQLISLGLRATTSDLPALLASMGIEPLARGAALSVEVDGKLLAPNAHGELVVRGIGMPAMGLPDVPQLTTRFRLADGTLHVDSMSGAAFGGTIEGRGEMKVFDRNLTRMVRSPALTFRLEGKDVELATLLGLGWASGKISFVATASGPLDRLRAHVELPPGATLQLFGSPWALGGIDVEVDARELVVRTARLSRPSGGAEIHVEGRMAFGGPMTWRLVLKDLAIESLPGVAGLPVPITGRLSADLTASGVLPRPALAGVLSLAAVTVRGTRLGDGKLDIAAVGDDAVTVKGNLFKRFDVDARATYGTGGPRVDAAVAFAGLKLEELLPELVALGDGRGLASGRVSVEYRPDAAAPLSVEARLADVQMSITRQVEGRDGRLTTQRVWVKNAGDLRAVMVGDRVVLDPARLVTDGGEFKVKGELVGQTLNAALSGHLGLDLLQPFLGQQVRRLSGDLAVELKVTGTTSRPRVEGSVAVARPVKVQPVAVDPEITIPTGIVRLGPDTIQLNDLAVSVEGATVTVAGKARYDEKFAPTQLELDVKGELAGSLLAALAPEVVSEATGKARVNARLTGTAAAPVMTARVDFVEMDLRLPALGREVTVESGTVELTAKDLLVKNVKVRIDEQGLLTIGGAGSAPGRVVIRKLYPQLELGYVELPLRGDRLSYQIPDLLAIDDISFTLKLSGNLPDRFTLDGQVLIASGQYVQDFVVSEAIISPRITESRARPFYEGIPALEQLRLALRVRTVGDSFIVNNNLAPEIRVTMDLSVGGRLSDPRISGDLRPTEGRFHIPGMHGDFDLVPQVNYVTFVGTKSIADGATPELNLQATNLVTDSQGDDHNVNIRIRGPIGQMAIDLWTDGGLNRSQTLMLLLSKRADDGSGFGTTSSPTLGSNLRTGTDMFGQISRDAVSNLVEPYIGNTLALLTGRRITLRPTVGADGFELKLLGRLGQHSNFQLSYLRGFQNQQRYHLQGSVWVMDYLSLRGVGERVSLSPQQGISEDKNLVNLGLTLDFPLRFGP